MSRFFHLIETDKEHNITTLAEGIEFTNGKLCISWVKKDFPNSIVVWDNINDFRKISVQNLNRQIIFGSLETFNQKEEKIEEKPKLMEIQFEKSIDEQS